MSPEQARGERLDRRTDCWSFGCVLFELIAGRPPFVGDTVSATLARVLAGEPDWAALPVSTPRRVRTLLRRCLQRDRDTRLDDIGLAREALQARLASPFAAINLPGGRLTKHVVLAVGVTASAALALLAVGAAARVIGVRVAPRPGIANARRSPPRSASRTIPRGPARARSPMNRTPPATGTSG